MSVEGRETFRWRVAAAICAVAPFCFGGCLSGVVDSFVAGPVIDRAAANPDLNEACSMGAALTDAIMATGSARRSPHRALIVAETTAAMCDEAAAWEASLDAIHAETTLPASDPGRIPAIKDARIREARARRHAAVRYYHAYQQLVSEWGDLDESNCPRLHGNDEFIYLLGLYAATEAVLHDKASGGQVGVPLDLLPRVARATRCVDSERWWGAPRALQAAAWASVPGSGPEGVDPWAQLREVSEAGAASGVRLGWALYALVAANAGRDDDVRMCVRKHATSLEEVPQNPDWALLDDYARLVTLHESDVLWMAARGYRTPEFGRLPEDDAATQSSPLDTDPFADEPAEGGQN